MKVLSTQVNHLKQAYEQTDATFTLLLCKCPAGIVWEIHNFFIYKPVINWCHVGYLQIRRNGEIHFTYPVELSGNIAIIKSLPDMFYLSDGDELLVYGGAWFGTMDMTFSWGVVEHRG